MLSTASATARCSNQARTASSAAWKAMRRAVKRTDFPSTTQISACLRKLSPRLSTWPSSTTFAKIMALTMA